jgi:hypothetical protein
MMVELPRIIIPFLTAFLNVLTAALSIGMLPALWILAREKRFGRLWLWLLITAVFVTAAVYALPLAHEAWKEFALKGFKPVAMYMGYFVGLLFVPMLLPEPLRVAQRIIRNVRNERPKERERRVRRLRHKRRKEGFPTNLR